MARVAAHATDRGVIRHAMPLRGDRNQCPTCSEYFNSSSAFDRHRTGRFGVDRRCRTVGEMAALGMSANAGGFWITEPLPEAAGARLRAAVSAPEGSEYHPDETSAPAAQPGRSGR